MNYLQAWASGFIDGEGCFLIDGKKKDVHGEWRYFVPALSVHLRDDNESALQTMCLAIGEFASCAERRPRRISKLGSVSKPTLQYKWQSKSSLLAITSMIDTHPLMGVKFRDYVVWKKAVEIHCSNLPPSERAHLLRDLKKELSEVRKYKEPQR